MQRFALGASVTLASLLVACGSSMAASSGTTTLKMSWEAGENKPVDTLIANFEKAYPKIKVTPEFLPEATYGQAIQTEMQAGNGPDLVWGATGSGQPQALGELEAKGYLLNLKGQPYARSVPKDTELYFGKSNGLYGVPVGVFPIGAVYNVTAMQKAGISIPTTFSQLISDCKTATAKGLIFDALPGQNPNLVPMSLGSNYVYNTDLNWNAQRDAKKVTFAGSKGWTAMFQSIATMNTAGCFGQGAAAMPLTTAFTDVADGTALTVIGPANAIAAVQGSTSKSVKLAMFAWPGTTVKSTRIPISFGQGLAINKSSKSIKQAEEFISFAMRAKNQNQLANDQGSPSLAQYQAGHLTPQLSAMDKLIKAKQTTPYEALTFPNAAVGTVFDNDVTGLLTGQVSIPDGLKDLDEAWTTGKVS